MSLTPLPWVEDDDGRKAAGFKGTTGDCVTRSIAIVTQRPYKEIYDELMALSKAEQPKAGRRRSSPRTGVQKDTWKTYLSKLGYTPTVTMGIGTGYRVHLACDEVPMNGRFVVQVTRHVTAVIDGVIHDTHDPGRGGTRCVYGYWGLRESYAFCVKCGAPVDFAGFMCPLHERLASTQADWR